MSIFRKVSRTLAAGGAVVVLVACSGGGGFQLSKSRPLFPTASSVQVAPTSTTTTLPATTTTLAPTPLGRYCQAVQVLNDYFAGPEYPANPRPTTPPAELNKQIINAMDVLGDPYRAEYLDFVQVLQSFKPSDTSSLSFLSSTNDAIIAMDRSCVAVSMHILNPVEALAPPVGVPTAVNGVCALVQRVNDDLNGTRNDSSVQTLLFDMAAQASAAGPPLSADVPALVGAAKTRSVAAFTSALENVNSDCSSYEVSIVNPYPNHH